MRNVKQRVISAVSAVALALSIFPAVPIQADSLSTSVTEPFSSGVSFTLPDDSSTTSQYYRIPAMVTLADGTIVAAADARWNTHYDGGGLDTLVARSDDGGVSWSYTLANYLGDNGNKYNAKSSCFIDPCLVVDPNGKDVYMLVDLYPHGIALNGRSGYTAPSTDTGFDKNGNLLLKYNGSNKYDHYLDLTNYTIYSSDGESTGIKVDEKFNYQIATAAYDLRKLGNTEPTEETTAPTEVTDPTEATTAPTEATDPTEATTAPTEATTAPTEATTAPTEATTAPTEETTAPTEATTAPTEATTAPTEATTAPTEATVAPTEATTAPTEDTQPSAGDNSKSLLGEILDDLVPTASAAELDTAAATSYNLFLSDSPYQVARTGFLYLTKSTDGGKTWGAPQLLNLKSSKEMVCLVGPGRGVTTSKGKMVIPIYSYNGSAASQRMGFLYSSNGTSWTRVDSSVNWSSESAVVELANGNLRFFYRNGTKQLHYIDYSFASSSWGTAQNTDIYTNSNTQISAITYSKKADDDSQVILVSCPISPFPTGSDSSATDNRTRGRLFVFNDDGKSMELKKTVEVNNSTFLYSCLTERSDGSVALLYENSWDPCGMDMVAYTAADLGLTSDDTDDEGGDTGGTGDTGTNTETITMTVGETKEVTTAGTATSGTFTTDDGITRYVVENVQSISHPDTTANRGTNSRFTGDTVKLHEALYTFTGDNTNGFTIQNGEYYLTVRNSTSAGYPGRKQSEKLVFTNSNFVSDAFNIINNQIPAQPYYLYFHKGTDNRFDRQTNTEQNETAFLLYAPVGTTGTSSTELPGYYQITSTDEIKDGGKYLIVAQAGSTYFALYPSDSTSNKYSHVAKVTGEPVTCTEGTTGTKATFTGLKPGTTTVSLGTTTVSVTVLRKETTKNITLTTEETATLDPVKDLKLSGNGYTVSYSLEDDAVITLADNVVAPKGTGGSATVVASVMKDGTVYGSVTYHVTVTKYEINDVKYIYIPKGSYYEVTFANADGTEEIIDSMLDTDVATVTWSSTDGLMERDGTFTAYGKEVGTTAVVVGTTKFILYVYEDTVPSTYYRKVYIYIDTIENCTTYFAVNGGALQEVEGTGLLIDKQTSGGFHIIFFAKPDDGYLLTRMGATGSDSQFYSLSDGTKEDGTDSSAWPWDSNGNVKKDTLANGTTRDHGIYGCVQLGIMTKDQLSDLFQRALELGCDGATNFTRAENSTAQISTNMEFVAEKLPDFEKSIIGYKRGNPAGLSDEVKASDAANGKLTLWRYTDYYNFDSDVTLEFGDTLLYQFTITTHSTDAQYTNISLKDEKIGYTKSITNGAIDNADSYAYYGTYELKRDDLHMYTGGKFVNSAELSYQYKSEYSSGVYDETASATATCDIIGIVSYVWVDGTPADIVNNKDGKYTLPASFPLTVGDTFQISEYTGKTEYKDSNGDIWTYSGEWGAYPYGASKPTWFKVTSALNRDFVMENARSITFYGRWLKNYTVLYRWGGTDHPQIEPPAEEVYPDKAGYTVNATFYTGYTVVDGGYTWTFQGWKKDDTGEVCTGTGQIDGEHVHYVGRWTKTANITSLTICKNVDKSYGTGEKFLFKVSGGSGEDLIVTVEAGKSVTVQGLPVGTKYTVTELTDWSWRYKADSASKEKTLTENADQNVLTFDNTLKKTQWLSGDHYNENQFSINN